MMVQITAININAALCCITLYADRVSELRIYITSGEKRMHVAEPTPPDH